MVSEPLPCAGHLPIAVTLGQLHGLQGVLVIWTRLQCRHEIHALNAGAAGTNDMTACKDELTNERSFHSQATCVIDVIALSF